jgi:hypothetical protein
VISCGRGNRFGHPTPEVLHRLAAIGATILRTDLDGQIELETDGRLVVRRTFAGRNAAGRPLTLRGVVNVFALAWDDVLESS